jgi:hypothetical protein
MRAKIARPPQPLSVLSCLAEQLDAHYIGLDHGIACHQATFCFFYMAAYRTLPTQDQLLDAPVFVNNLLKLPSRLLLQNSMKNHAKEGLKASTTGALVKPGSVVIFCKTNNLYAASHSCVAKTSSSLAGYNQKSWYNEGGEEGKYSLNSTKTKIWSKDDKTIATRPGELSAITCKLFAIPEEDARKTLEAIID